MHVISLTGNNIQLSKWNAQMNKHTKLLQTRSVETTGEKRGRHQTNSERIFNTGQKVMMG